MRKPACCDMKGMNKGTWSQQEDQKLRDYIEKHGEVCWCTLPQAAGLLRCGNSCRLRWTNYLQSDVKRGNFGEDEEDLIIKLHALLGNRWSLIAERLPGRTDNEVKNYWNSHIRRKLISKGIDPNNHRLSRKIPTLLQNPPSSKNKPIKPHVERYGQASEAAYVENDSYTLPDLNLDLSISIHSASQFASSSTLPLFQKSFLKGD